MKLEKNLDRLVKKGLNKKTKKEVVIKIMNKNDMKTEDIELIRTEIEILKICQHPNIIHLYELVAVIYFHT